MYKVLLDGVEFTDIAVDEFVSKLGRDIQEKGFTKTYDQQLTFFREAYSYIKNLASETGGCGSIEIEVFKSCGGTFSLVASGYILLKDVVFEEAEGCEVTIEIEDNTVNGIFINGKNSEVFMDRTSLPNGTPVASIRKPLRNFFASNGSYLPQTDGVDYAYGYSYFDAFDFILRNISNDQLRFKSDFFTTKRQDAEWEFAFHNLTVGEIVTITFDNEYGDTYNFVVIYDTPVTSFAAYIVAPIHAHLGYYVSYSIVGSSISFNVVSNGRKGTLVNVESDGSADVDFGTVNEYIEGGADLYISNGDRLTNTLNTAFVLTFDRLYEIVNSLFDLSYNIEEDAGQYYLRVEPVEYFLNDAVAINLGVVTVKERKFISDRIAGALMLGQDYGYTVDSETYKFRHLNCGDNIDRRIPSNVHISFVAIIAQVSGTEDFSDDLFLIEGEGLSGAYDEPKRYDEGEYPGGSFSNYNVLLSNTEALLRYHLFFLPDAIDRQLKTITIEIDSAGNPTTFITNKDQDYIGNPKQYLSLYNFEAPLSLSQYQQINGTSMIKFYAHTSPTIERLGYIQDVEFPVKTGVTDFTLIVKNME